MYTRYVRFKREKGESEKGKKGRSSDSVRRSSQAAVAIGYDAEHDSAPRVLASGRGLLAEHILAIAVQNNIPIRQDPLLVAALASVEVDTLIPPELYAVIAEVLAYVYRVRQKKNRPEDYPQPVSE